MPHPIQRIPIQIETAAGTTSGPSRLSWMGYIASGVTHLAGGLLLGSVWGTAVVQLVPPPYGANAIHLTATQVVAVEVTRDDDAGQPLPATTVVGETSDQAASSTPPPRRNLRPDTGEMPPAPFAVRPGDPADSASAHTRRPSSLLPARTTSPTRMPDARPTETQTSALALSKSPTPQPPVRPDTAAAPAPPSTPRQGQDADSPPTKVFSPAPVYPAAALRDGITGRVVLRVRVAADGGVTAASVLRSSGREILDDAALAAVRQWRFQPARQLGLAIEKEIAVPIVFRIDRSP